MRATGRRGPSLQSLVLACENKDPPAQSIEEENQPGSANQLAGQCEHANAIQKAIPFSKWKPCPSNELNENGGIVKEKMVKTDG